MNSLQPATEPSTAPARASRLQSTITAALLVALACSGTTSCTTSQIVLSSAAIAAAVVGTTVGVTLAVQNHRHTLQGCVFSGPNGTELRTSDSKVYALEGSAASIKVGDHLKLHGSKLKGKRGSSGDPVFVVEKVSKDDGQCSAASLGTPSSQ